MFNQFVPSVVSCLTREDIMSTISEVIINLLKLSHLLVVVRVFDAD